MMRLPYAYCVRSPRYRTTYYRTSLGAYNRAVAMLRSDDEITEPTRDYGYDDGLGIWQRTPEGGWQFDHITTATAWGNDASRVDLLRINDAAVAAIHPGYIEPKRMPKP